MGVPRPTTSTTGDMHAASWPLVCQANGLRPLVDDLVNHLQSVSPQIICLTGLPGVGKTETAAVAAEEAASSFAFRVSVLATSGMDLVTFMDEAYRQLPIERVTDATFDKLTKELTTFLAQQRVLISVDNADVLPQDTLAYLFSLLAKARSF